MVNIIFNFKEENAVLECQKEDKLKDICNNFVSKIGININNLYFFYNGNPLNMELTYDEQVDSIDRNLNEMKILVHEKNKTIDIKELKKSKEIICPKCNDYCRINIKDYKIKLYDCKNEHETNDILLDEYNNTQTKNNMDEPKIICGNCDIRKSYKHNNKFYKCLTCKLYLCSLCISLHNNHIIIDNDKINYTCHIHNQLYNSYCNNCKRNICKLCQDQEDHELHEIIYYQEIRPNDKEIKEQLYDFRQKLDKFKCNIRDIMKLLNKVIDNMEIFYKINTDIVNSYEPEMGNYQLIQNMNVVKNIINIKDIDEVINDNNIYNKFQNILNISNKMNDKNLYNTNVKIDKNKEIENGDNTGEIDNIIIKYSINTKDMSNIKIFDKYFINNNRKKCKFIYEDKSYELIEHFNLSNYKIDKDILEIKLTGINNVTNMSYMFCGCSSLMSLPDINKWDTKNILNMKYMFTGCS